MLKNIGFSKIVLILYNEKCLLRIHGPFRCLNASAFWDIYLQYIIPSHPLIPSHHFPSLDSIPGGSNSSTSLMVLRGGWLTTMSATARNWQLTLHFRFRSWSWEYGSAHCMVYFLDVDQIRPYWCWFELRNSVLKITLNWLAMVSVKPKEKPAPLWLVW